MPYDTSWPPPSPEALDLIEKVYRLASTLRIVEINPGALGIAVIVSLREAFILLDHLSGPWSMEVWAPSPVGVMDIETVQFDLSITPRPGMKWGLLFGITLIVDEDTTADTTRK